MTHILEDPDFRKHFRMIAYDMPFHGKSVPPASQKWWNQNFQLTKNFLLEMVLGISEKLKLDRPVFIGSAMGGMLGLDLAYYHPGKFRAVIALNAGPPAKFDESVLTQMGTFSHPRVSSRWTSTMMVVNTAATSPEVYRRELRQFEQAPLSNTAVERSRAALAKRRGNARRP
jgi:pimeloyl-ACP methyl ester carboxylesterase